MPALRRSTQIITPLVAAVTLGALVAPAAAVARPGGDEPRPRTLAQSPKLWATVNICDTVDRPNAIGLRASMPGTGFAAERMFVRFQVQYLSARDGKWHTTGPSGDSGWVALGSGRYKARQGGRTFTLQAPDEGTSYTVRGAATFEWRRGDRVVRRVRERTTGGHPGTRGADPSHFSAATCVIR